MIVQLLLTLCTVSQLMFGGGLGFEGLVGDLCGWTMGMVCCRGRHFGVTAYFESKG